MNTASKLPSSIVDIDISSFWGCNSLQPIIIPTTVKNIKCVVTPPDGIDFTRHRDFYFTGNAPEIDIDNITMADAVRSVNSVTGEEFYTYKIIRTDIYYPQDASGWVELVQSVGEREDIKFCTYDPLSDKTAIITYLSPAKNASDVSYTSANFQIDFDREIASIDGQPYIADVDLTMKDGFSIYRASDNKLIYTPGQYETNNFVLNMEKDRLSITPTNSHLLFEAETEYYIIMSEGFITFVDGSTNPVIKKGDWFFRTKEKNLYGSNFKMGVDSFCFNNDSEYYGSIHLICDEYYEQLRSKLTSSEKFVVGINKKASFSFEGACFGSAAVMGLMYTGALSPQDYGAKDVFHLSYPKDDFLLTSLINYYYYLQWLPTFEEEDVEKSPQERGKELVTSLMSGSTPIMVTFKYSDGDDHAVLAYALDNTDLKNYLIYCADPNYLVDKNGNAFDPTILRLDRYTYQISGYSMDQCPDQIRSVFSDYSIFDKYNDIQNIETIFQPSKYTHLTASNPNFTISANGRTSTVNGESIKGDLAIYQTYNSLSGNGESNFYSYCIEPADYYTITYPNNSKTRDTLLRFSATTGNAGRAETTADTVTFRDDGTLEITNASGVSTLSTVNDTVYDSWCALTATGSVSNLSIYPDTDNCTITSTDTLGKIDIIGISDWNNVVLNATIADNTAYVVELKEPGKAEELALKATDGTVLASTPAVYSVVYMAQGGSFVDAVKQIPYGAVISAPTNPTYEGYTFSGWYKNSNCSVVTPPQPKTAIPTSDKLEVDGKAQTPAAYKLDDYNYFKLRDLATLLNGSDKQFSVDFNPDNGVVTLTTGQPYTVTGTETVGPVQSGVQSALPSDNAIYVDGTRIQFTAYQIGGYNYFKLRDLGKALNFYVGWTPDRGMFIESEKPYFE